MGFSNLNILLELQLRQLLSKPPLQVKQVEKHPLHYWLLVLANLPSGQG